MASVKTKYLTNQKAEEHRVNWFRGTQRFSGGSITTTSGHSFASRNAALCHNFGFFVTGRAPVLPSDAYSAKTSVFSLFLNRIPSQVRLFLLGCLALCLADLLIVNIPWTKLGAAVLTQAGSFASVKTDNNALPTFPTANTGSKVKSSSAQNDQSLFANAVNADLTQSAAPDTHESVMLPAIGSSGQAYSWFVQIGDFGRIMYQATPDENGESLANNGMMHIDID